MKTQSITASFNSPSGPPFGLSAAIYDFYRSREGIVNGNTPASGERKLAIEEFKECVEAGSRSQLASKYIERSSRNGIILIVDDEGAMLTAVKAVLEKSFVETAILTASSGYEALDMIDVMVPSVVLLDMIMPGLNGYEVLHTLQIREVNIPIIVMSGYVNESNFDRPDLKLPFDITFLEKPFRMSELIIQVQKALVKSRTLAAEKSALRAGKKTKSDAPLDSHLANGMQTGMQSRPQSRV